MTDLFVIRDARPQQAEELTALALRSKAYWGYSPEFIEACRAELSVSPEKIASELLHYVVAECDLRILGFYAIEQRSEHEFELEALFVDPPHIGTGLGKALMHHAKQKVLALGGKSLMIQGDPNAERFYRAVGGERIGERASASIAGRSLPLFMIKLDNEPDA